jgi:dystrophin
MLQLTKHQGPLGSVLQRGKYLIAEGKVNDEEEREIRLQMSLLNNRWEELRVKAMDRQTRYFRNLKFCILCSVLF